MPIQTVQLDCGAPLLLEPMSGVRSLALTIVVAAGFGHEPENRQGLAAMWSELLLRGAGELASKQHADALDRLGVSRGVNAGVQFLAVSATMLGERLEESLPLLTDMVLRPRFDPESVEPARELALQAIESLKDDPTQRAMLAARARHYSAPINRSGLGTPEGLAAISRADLVSAWATRARPGSAIIAVAGHMDPAKATGAFNARLAGWAGTAGPFETGAAPPRGYAHESDQTNQVQIVVVHDAPAENTGSSRQSLLEKVVVNVLSGGMSGRLFTEVREKRGLCYSVSAAYRGDRDFGGVTAYVGTTPERAQESLDVLLAELERINTPEGRVTPEELRRALIGMKSRLIFSGESTAARAGALAGDQHRYGRGRSLEEIAAQIDSVSLDEVNSYLVFRRLGRLTVQTLGPAPLSFGAGS